MLSPEQIALLEKPFRKDEHGEVSKNPYILKSAIRRRLYQVDPNYELGAPEVMIHDQDVIVLRGPLTIGDVTHYGVGTGLIIRTRKDDKTGEVFDLPLYDIARNMAKAYKQAASDILPRAAIQFNCGVYLAEKPKGMTLDDLLKKLGAPTPPAGKPSTTPPPQPTPLEPPARKPWADKAEIDDMLAKANAALGLTWLDVSLFTGIGAPDDYDAWNTEYVDRAAARDAIKAGQAEALAKMGPAKPKAETAASST